MQHEFTPEILQILSDHFGEQAEYVFQMSPLLQYINIKTRSAARGSKSRASFGNLYAMYALISDYLANNFDKRSDYNQYEGARFTDLLKQMRALPFGEKLQNHALNHRLNEEFRKYFPQVPYLPILRDTTNNRYWINQNLLRITQEDMVFETAQAILIIIQRYIEAKQAAFKNFIETCQQLQNFDQHTPSQALTFVQRLLAPSVDARIFEIASYSILRYFYAPQQIYWGKDLANLHQEHLQLYKTSRTNANDGGIDFVMRPIGRFFQVTETLEIKKYLLDIEKVEHFPVTFVIKSELPVETIYQRIEEKAHQEFGVKRIVQRYLAAIEEIINLPILRERLSAAASAGNLDNILHEIIFQSRIEFNLDF